jgi:hypothetical protein
MSIASSSLSGYTNPTNPSQVIFVLEDVMRKKSAIPHIVDFVLWPCYWSFHERLTMCVQYGVWLKHVNMESGLITSKCFSRLKIPINGVISDTLIPHNIT